MSNFSQNFPLNLRRAMQAKEISLNTLSEQTGISNKTIHGWLVGKSPRSIKDVYKIARFLDVTLDYLFTGQLLPEGVPQKQQNLKLKKPKNQKILKGSFQIVLDE